MKILTLIPLSLSLLVLLSEVDGTSLLASETKPSPTLAPVSKSSTGSPLDPYQKLVDNRGKGEERLYGTRNFRGVIKDAFYRGGANNVFLKENKRDNRNPLTELGVKNLCSYGISKAFYLYKVGFETAPKKMECTVDGKPHTLTYELASPFSVSGQKKVFAEIQASIQDPKRGPVYAHCWNGWHASGLISALALKQFCGWSGEKAIEYWDKNTDGNNRDPHFKTIRKQIADFKPFQEFSLTQETQSQICPKTP